MKGSVSLFVTTMFALTATAGLTAETRSYDALAENLVTQSLGVQPGEVVIINGGPTEVELMGALQIAVAKAGGQPVLQLSIPEASKRVLLETPIEHLKRPSTFGLMQARAADCQINVTSTQDPTLFADVPEERLAATREAGKALQEAFRRIHTRNVSLGQTGGIPTKAYAASKGADYERLSEMFWRAVGVAPDELAKDGNHLAGMMTAGTEVRVTSKAGTDLRFQFGRTPARINAGRTADVLQASGPANVWLPAGEAYACVASGSATGTAVVPYTTFRGIDIENLTMTFANGRMTKMNADKGGEALREFFDSMQANAKDLSVVDVGLNPHSQPMEGSRYLSWEMGGVVTIGMGNNSWAGGDNDADGGFNFHLAGTSVTIGGTAVVSSGRLATRVATAK